MFKTHWHYKIKMIRRKHFYIRESVVSSDTSNTNPNSFLSLKKNHKFKRSFSCSHCCFSASQDGPGSVVVRGFSGVVLLQLHSLEFCKLDIAAKVALAVKYEIKTVTQKLCCLYKKY